MLIVRRERWSGPNLMRLNAETVITGLYTFSPFVAYREAITVSVYSTYHPFVCSIYVCLRVVRLASEMRGTGGDGGHARDRSQRFRQPVGIRARLKRACGRAGWAATAGSNTARQEGGMRGGGTAGTAATTPFEADGIDRAVSRYSTNGR